MQMQNSIFHKREYKDYVVISITMTSSNIRNIITLPSLQQCFGCKANGFFTNCSSDSDVASCPCCKSSNYLHSTISPSQKFIMDDQDMRVMYKYCQSCGILFEAGCLHAKNIYNAHFIKTWRHLDTKEVFTGMPWFASVDEWNANVNKIQVLELYCPHKGAMCSTVQELMITAYDNCDLNVSPKSFRNNMLTLMAVREHGQPYK